MAEQQVRVDSTETLLWYGPATAQPTAATVRVQTAAVALPDAGDTATIDTLSSATNAAASAGATSLAFAADPVATAGRQYLVVLATGQVIVVEVIDTGTTVTLAEPLPIDVPSGSTLTGFAVSHALTAAETDEIGRGIARWSITVAGIIHVVDQSFRIVRSQPQPYSLTATVLTARYPILHRYRPPTDEDFAESIEAAWEVLLMPDLLARGYEPHRINSWRTLEVAHAAAVYAHLVGTSGVASTELVEAAMAHYRGRFDAVVESSEFWYDSIDEDTSHEEVRGLSRVTTVVM